MVYDEIGLSINYRAKGGLAGMILKIQSLDEFYSPRTFLLAFYIALLVILACIFLAKNRKVEIIGAKRIHQGYALFALTYALTRTFFLLSDYEIGYNNGTITQLHLIWVTAAYSITFISLMFINFSVERYILNRKPVLMLVALAVFIICIASLVLTVLGIGLDVSTNTGPHRIAQYSLYIAGPVLALGIMSLYIVLFRQGTGDVKKKAGMAIAGLLVLLVGLLLDMDILANPAWDAIRYILSPVAFIIGTIVFFYAQR